MKTEYIIGWVLLLLVSLGLIVLFVSSPKSIENGIKTVEVDNPYVEIVNPSGFVNSDGITIGELVGKKVIMVDFLTYSCINCQRTFPYMNAWYEKYKDEGLEIVGIHTPEFAFEKDIDNVKEAMKKFGIKYPIVLDNDYSTWQAYKNQYWPRKYLIDIHGNVVYDHIGEGAYEETEAKIVELLKERKEVLGESSLDISGDSVVSTITPTKVSSLSPETYFGSLRNEYLANGPVNKTGEQFYVLPKTYELNRLYLGGSWNIQGEYGKSITTDSVVVYKYNAKEVYIVAQASKDVVVEVRQDGKLVNESKGEDVDSSGKLKVRESRLYKLINNNEAGEHTLELKINGSDLEFFAFTFG